MRWRNVETDCSASLHDVLSHQLVCSGCLCGRWKHGGRNQVLACLVPGRSSLGNQQTYHGWIMAQNFVSCIVLALIGGRMTSTGTALPDGDPEEPRFGGQRLNVLCLGMLCFSLWCLTWTILIWLTSGASVRWVFDLCTPALLCQMRLFSTYEAGAAKLMLHWHRPQQTAEYSVRDSNSCNETCVECFELLLSTMCFHCAHFFEGCYFFPERRFVAGFFWRLWAVYHTMHINKNQYASFHKYRFNPYPVNTYPFNTYRVNTYPFYVSIQYVSIQYLSRSHVSIQYASMQYISIQ